MPCPCGRGGLGSHARRMGCGCPDAIMKRIDFDLTPDQELALTRIGPCQLALMLGAVFLAFVLFVSAASAGEYAACNKVKTGTSGQMYAFKDGC